MDIRKLIIISVIVFVVAFILYAIVVSRDSIKNFILKVDKKLTERNEKINSKKEEEKQAKQNEELLEYEESSSPKLLTFKSGSSSKNKTAKSSSGNSKGSKSSGENAKTSAEGGKDAKVKPNKSAGQIRPILLPPDEEKESEDIKLLEMQKRPEMLNKSPQKELNFKYGSKNAMQTQSASAKASKTGAPIDDFISFGSNSKDSYNPLKRDTKRQFDDIKNFLDLPENQDTLKTQGVSYNGKEFKTVDKIDPAIFGGQEGYYVNYNSQPQKPKPTSNLYNNYRTQSNLINSASSSNENDLASLSDIKRFIDSSGNEVMQAQTKYAKPRTPTSSFAFGPKKPSQIYNEYSAPLTQEQDEIDLNKLPSNIKKMIIQNILDRKTYDD